MSSATVENYLKALLSLSREGEVVSVTGLANALAVSKPAANSMVKSLHAQGLVDYKRYKPLSLTPQGRKAAALIVRKHRLTEMFLVDQMGFGWEEVHEIAEQMEHIQSPKFFARMDELMGFPTVDPHGSPIPSPEGVIDVYDYRKLTDVAEGELVALKAVTADSGALLGKLTKEGIHLGQRLELVKQLAHGTEVKLENGASLILAQDVAQVLRVA